MFTAAKPNATFNVLNTSATLALRIPDKKENPVQILSSIINYEMLL